MIIFPSIQQSCVRDEDQQCLVDQLRSLIMSMTLSSSCLDILVTRNFVFDLAKSPMSSFHPRCIQFHLTLMVFLMVSIIHSYPVVSVPNIGALEQFHSFLESCLREQTWTRSIRVRDSTRTATGHVPSSQSLRSSIW